MKYLSSPQQLEDFKKTTLYQDLKTELKIRISGLRDLLESEGYSDNDGKFHSYKGGDYDKFRGGIRNMREMFDIFDDIKELVIADREAEEVPE